jgi:PKD repeat protein
VTATSDQNGVITIVKELGQKISGAFPATIRDAEGKALPGKILLYPPYYADPVEPPESQCVYSVNPAILGEIETDLPVDNISVNEEVTFMIPAELVAGCDESSQLEAVFIINNQTVPAELNEEGLYVARHTFTQPGNKVVTFQVKDANPEHQTPEGTAPTAQVQINFYVKPLEVEVDVCEVSGEPKAGGLTADKSEVKVGDPVTFTLTGVGDCDGGEANLLVELQAYGVSVEMVPAGNGSYVTTMGAVLAGPPFKAIVTDLERGTSTTRELWNIPTVLSSFATPPVVNLAVTPTSGASPLPVTVDLSGCYAIDEGDEITHFEVNWGDGNIETVSGNSAEHVYLCLGGSCHQTLRVTAYTLNGGSASQQTTITVWDSE